ncbi:Speckle-type POZ protein-like protein [Aphelenchoides bicaudatus]|nr:Speckle-type POZ protein-like protein [Aphelenchoides bicaudatus]
MENSDGVKILDQTVLHYSFKENNLKWGVGLAKKKEFKLFDEVLAQKATIKICCKIELISSTPKEDTKHDLPEKLWNLYLADEGYDTIVQAGGRDFKVSKIIFTAQSEVFRNMFSRNFKEDTEKKVEIEYVSTEIMQTFIKWMYTGKIDKVAYIEDLYIVADRYLIEDLKKYCSNVMVFDLDSNNAAKRLTLALKHHDEELKEEVLKFIGQMAANDLLKLFASKDWTDYVLSQAEK